MSEYTQSFVVKAESLDTDEEKLLYDNAKEFRGFDKAFIAFISEHGYTGDLSNIKSMAKFVREKFAEAEVPELHNFRDLFNPNKGNTRETAFKICFFILGSNRNARHLVNRIAHPTRSVFFRLRGIVTDNDNVVFCRTYFRC